MDRFSGTTLVVATLVLLLLSGCSQEDLEEMANHETLSFEGLYSNQYNGNTITFSRGVMSYRMQKHTVTRDYQVEDSHVFIKLASSSKEKREDLIMRIHGDGELLTCSTCAMYNMVNIWIKEDFVAPDTPMVTNAQ
jgi:lipocalin